MRLKDKVAIVTGAASGFGEGIAQRFAAEGAAVVIADVDDARGAAVAADLERSGRRAIFCRADVVRAVDMAAMVQAALTRFGRLDILVNNAGLPQRPMPLETVPEEMFDRLYAINVKGVYLGICAALPALRAAGGGSIINMASTAGLSPRPGLSAYNATKGAVITLTRSLALELARDRIRVNCLCPVAGDTPMLRDFTGDDPARRAAMLATVPLGRFSTPQDLASAALWLASDEAAFITGIALPVDGGRTI
ncbi:MAG: glucose 1-dehydrogenase [Alphaproteobacteria bacterium]|nr:glucose 1-dehydrogenase [Alphaproteobacteria bacterium]